MPMTRIRKCSCPATGTSPARPNRKMASSGSGPGDNAGWTAEIHGNQGNVGLADGSVQQYSNAGLQKALQDFGNATNVWRLALPE